MTDGTYAYTLRYDVAEGQVKNAEGELIQGPLQQHLFNLESRAIEGQQVRLRYDREDPMVYELLEDIEFMRETTDGTGVAE